jgi:hypothetical protein
MFTVEIPKAQYITSGKKPIAREAYVARVARVVL